MMKLGSPARRRGTAWCAAALALGVAGTACDGDGGGCEFPTGSYTVQIAYAFGDCDSDLVSEVMSGFPVTSSIWDPTCGDERRVSHVDDAGCDVTLQIDLHRGKRGVEDSVLSVERDCGFTQCTAYFDLFWTHL